MGENLTQKSHLPLHEWFIILVILGFLASIALVSWFSCDKAAQALQTHADKSFQIESITIEVQGEVLHPGIYHFPPGIVVKKIIRKAKFSRYADRSGFDETQRVYSSCVLIVPRLQKLVVYLAGAVKNPGPVIVPLDFRLKDLRNQVQLLEEASPAAEKFLKSRRFLRHEEVIWVPFKDHSERPLAIP